MFNRMPESHATPKQRRSVEEFQIDFNATQAAVRFEVCQYEAKEKESFNWGSSVLRIRRKITISGDDILAGLLIAAPFVIIFTIPLLPFLIP